jgi:voltage-gated potassium channel
MNFFFNKKTKNLIKTFLQSPKLRIATILIVITILSTLLFFIIEKKSGNNNVRNFFDSFWYMISTLLTVGYGDITPISMFGRFIGIFAMIFGVVFIAGVTGQISSSLIEKQLKKERGLLKLKKKQNHFIICGWKNDFELILDGIMDANPQYDINDIVLINMAQDYMQLMLEKPKYKLINFIYGDFIDESILLKANIKQAKKALILADMTANYNPLEIDSRTIMTAMSLNKLNKNIYTIAELLDEKFEKYLQMAHCDEIVLSKEYERVLLINASSGSGISHVVRDLLDVENNRKISIEKIPQSLIGISFKNAFDYFTNQKKAILIGILENTGNFYSRKSEALINAQKTPDISKLVENLQKVKELKPNNPVLNPGFEYIIKEHSMAIIIGGA